MLTDSSKGQTSSWAELAETVNAWAGTAGLFEVGGTLGNQLREMHEVCRRVGAQLEPVIQAHMRDNAHDRRRWASGQRLAMRDILAAWMNIEARDQKGDRKAMRDALAYFVNDGMPLSPYLREQIKTAPRLPRYDLKKRSRGRPRNLDHAKEQQIITEVDQLVSRRLSITRACEFVAPRFGLSPAAVKRRYFRAHESISAANAAQNSIS